MHGRVTMMKPSSIRRLIAGVLLMAAAGGAVAIRLHAARHAKTKVLGLNKVIAFTYSGAKDFDPKQLHSVTLIGPVNASDWKYWRPRGVVTGIGHGWSDLLRSPIDKAVDNLTGQDFGGNPQPVMMIDEFGFDYGGLMDEKSAQILRRPNLKNRNWPSRSGTCADRSRRFWAEAYRDAADLVMLESYVGNQKQYWWIASQVWSARKFGILPKTIVVLGLGKGGNPGENWAETKEELEQQIRFVRLVAPESPGVGFFGGTAELLASADALCTRFFQYPTNGSGLPSEVRDIAATFSRRYEKPTLVVSPTLVEPKFNEDGKGLADPNHDDEKVAGLMNLVVKRKPDHATQWSVRSAAAITRIPKSTVGRYFALFGLQPHRARAVQAFHRPVLRRKGARYRRAVSQSAGQRARAGRRREESGPGARSHPTGVADRVGLCRRSNSRLLPSWDDHVVRGTRHRVGPSDHPVQAAPSSPGVSRGS